MTCFEPDLEELGTKGLVISEAAVKLEEGNCVVMVLENHTRRFFRVRVHRSSDSFHQSGESPPIKQPVRRTPFALHHTVEELVQQMLAGSDRAVS